MQTNVQRVDPVHEAIPFKKPETRRARRHEGQKVKRHRRAVRPFSGRSVEGRYAHTRRAAPVQAIKRYPAARYPEFQRGMQAGEPLLLLRSRLYISKNTANNWMRQMHLDSETALRACGLNVYVVAERLARLLKAKVPKWNPIKKKFDMVEDYMLQLETLREIAHLLGMYPQPGQEETDDDPSLTVVMGDPVVLGTEPSLGTIPKVPSKSDDTRQVEGWRNQIHSASEATDSAVMSPLNERNESGSVADVGAQLSSSGTARVLSKSDKRKLQEAWRNYGWTAFEAPEFANPSPRDQRLNPLDNLNLPAPIVESAVEHFLKSLASLRASQESGEVEFNSWADVDLE